ncbi:MAG: hypothetical protein EZS28_043634 [Streblomastix strix]|uniref:Uncharacterized protein n=1 Tax=Streblomastix strix TaxID=222440 RepID=A0A5J4TSI3_9EUKA|nr:MAG: hypothetical protein EZS28_043634 [Streblomastix strix]
MNQKVQVILHHPLHLLLHHHLLHLKFPVHHINHLHLNAASEQLQKVIEEEKQKDQEEFIPTEFQLKMHMKYQKFLNPIEEGGSILDSINTGGRKEDESPITENSNSSDELKNYDNQ